MKSGICTEEGLSGRTVGKLFRQSRELLFCVCFFLAESGLGICLLPSLLLARTETCRKSWEVFLERDMARGRGTLRVL